MGLNQQGNLHHEFNELRRVNHRFRHRYVCKHILSFCFRDLMQNSTRFVTRVRQDSKAHVFPYKSGNNTELREHNDTLRRTNRRIRNRFAIEGCGGISEFGSIA